MTGLAAGAWDMLREKEGVNYVLFYVVQKSASYIQISATVKRQSTMTAELDVLHVIATRHPLLITRFGMQVYALACGRATAGGH